MHNESNLDFDILLKKSYKELGIKWIEHYVNHDYLVLLLKNFNTYFPDVLLSNPYIILLKTVAYVVNTNNISLSKSEIYDLFILSYKFLINYLVQGKNDQSSVNLRLMDNTVFEICNDILHNYDSYEETIRVQIPNLIVDVLTILFFKSDPYGKKISIFQLKIYYESKKKRLLNKTYTYPKILENSNEVLSSITNENYNLPSMELKVRQTIDSRGRSDYCMVLEDEIVHRLAQITERSEGDVRKSLDILPDKEKRKLNDICNNYNKILKYGKFDNLRDFKFEIENELGRPLSDKQVRHSQISIKKVQFYIENILDGKFEPHLTHGINHIKHNFEYGYRLVGLISNSRPKNKKIIKKVLSNNSISS